MCLMQETAIHVERLVRFVICSFAIPSGALFCLCFSLIFFLVDCINKNGIEYEYEKARAALLLYHLIQFFAPSKT